ncbi:MAG: SMC-Scp complex subunit ScpB [Candidatus Colwellbacteria bacterium]|nr:SMC-Scp complex subunit ScpB [Candidatus Colwellbacteria bacterium]
MSEQPLESKIEAIIFMSGSPISTKKIIDLVGCSEDEASLAITSLKERLSSSLSGISLMEADGSFQLVTKPELAPIIQKMVKDEMTEELTPAALETLSLITYIGPTTKSAIEYIRGVNSSFTIRNLLIRGLIERSIHPQKNNTYIYRPSLDLIRHLGLSRKEDMPDFDKFQELKKTLENEQA